MALRIVLEFLQVRVGVSTAAVFMHHTRPTHPGHGPGCPACTRKPGPRSWLAPCTPTPQMFRVVFNTEFAWVVHRDLWAFKAIRWVLWRFLVMPHGYDTYIVVFYIIAATTFVSLALTAYIAVVRALRRTL